MPGPADRPYHHGDLPSAVLQVTEVLLDEVGPAALSVREVARRAGVAHTSVAHHFGDKAGLLAAVAAEGYRRLGAELAAVHDAGGGFLDLGVAYVRFAVGNRAHFDLMFQPRRYRADDAEVAEARAVTSALLHGHAREIAGDGSVEVSAVAGWAIVHGLATLWLAGSLPAGLGDDPEAIVRLVAARLGPGGGHVDVGGGPGN